MGDTTDAVWDCPRHPEETRGVFRYCPVPGCGASEPLAAPPLIGPPIRPPGQDVPTPAGRFLDAFGPSRKPRVHKVPIDARWMRLLWAHRLKSGGTKNGAPGGTSISRLVQRALEAFFGVRLEDLQSDDDWMPRKGRPPVPDQTTTDDPPRPP